MGVCAVGARGRKRQLDIYIYMCSLANGLLGLVTQQNITTKMGEREPVSDTQCGFAGC